MVESKPPCGAPRDLSKKCSTVLQWTPAHCGIGGNERADRLAKEGGKQTQHTCKACHPERRKPSLKTVGRKPSERGAAATSPPQDSLHHLSRAQQTAIFRLRTGHCGLKVHLTRIVAAASALCDCGEEDQTPKSEGEPQKDRHCSICSV